MAETIDYSLRYLKDDDLKAMAEYIKEHQAEGDLRQFHWRFV